jgi:hypothetical protein
MNTGRPREWQDITILPGHQAHKDGRIRRGKKELVPHKKGSHLFFNVNGREYHVDELIAITFSNKPASARWVHLLHVDGSEANNATDNLVWVRDEFSELDWLMRQKPVGVPWAIEQSPGCHGFTARSKDARN